MRRLSVCLVHSLSHRYRILAVEQTSNSVSLEAYTFPTHAVLLLGKEKEGIPVEFLHLVDDVRPPSPRLTPHTRSQCIQIPQLGLTVRHTARPVIIHCGPHRTYFRDR